MSTARLRKAFRYPDDAHDSDEDLDEEHQERLITQLEEEDTLKSNLYRKAFLLVPAISILFFIYSFLIESTTAKQRFECLLSISSLVCTGYSLYAMPLGEVKRPGLMTQRAVENARGPIEKYLGLLNGALALVLALPAILTKGRQADELRSSLPLIVFLLTNFVRWQLKPLDLSDLKKASFDLKGA